MKVLEETPDRLVVQGTTVISEMSRGCGLLALFCIGLASLACVTALAQWGMESGRLSPGVAVAFPGVAVALLAFWFFRPKGSATVRWSAPTPGARVATFDAAAGIVEITGIGTFPLSRVRGALLETAEDAGDNVAICFYDREAVSLSSVTIGDRGRVQRVVDAIQAFLARLPQRESEPAPARAPVPPRPSAQEAQTKAEFEQALAVMTEEVEAERRRAPARTPSE